ncbi:putative eukaryotic translation initiation factor 2 subunit 3-like isoform 1 [Capsicum annuum]|nr:putative eukaryotic translation initiation factor 2 subunit 3-like isoform 1 [Capsicum annuum]
MNHETMIPEIQAKYNHQPESGYILGRKRDRLPVGLAGTTMDGDGSVYRWYTWRHQMVYLAERGYHAVAPDLKGYGDTTSKGLDAILDAPATLSSWLSEEELDYYASKFEKTGFTGPINYYRALPLDWELTAPWTGAEVKVQTKFIVGEFDLVYLTPGAKEYIHNGEFKKDVPLLEEVVVLEGAGHFVNQERLDEINQHIYDFIQKF